jgi:tripartite-type tricarboxylate transporter receptor subunit TctC
VKTPRDIVNRVSVETDKVLKSADIRQRFMVEGLEPIGGTPESFTTFVKSEIDKYAKVVKAAAIKQQ